MAEGQGVSSMPLPPMQYVNLYTDENVKRGRAPKPPPPVKDSYKMFGLPFQAEDQIVRTLESQGLRRLYPQNYDHKRELKKLNHSILVNFLDLLDLMIKSPDSKERTEKIEDLQLLYIHMHHLINEFRPHQARETLRVMMEVQKRQRLETAERFQKHLEKVQDLLRDCLTALPDDSSLAIIKTEPQDSSEEVVVKQEVIVKKEHGNLESGSDEDEQTQCSTLDRMMCNIVDAM